MRTYSSYVTDWNDLSGNSSTANTTRGLKLINDSIRYLVTKYYFNERSYTTTTVSQQQFYNLPPQVKKLINVTVSIGSILWLPEEAQSRAYWDALNVIQFFQDFPSFFFVYNNQVGIFPTPASAGNTITMNYKIRLRDLTQVDYSTGTVTAVSGSPTITGAGGATFSNSMAGQWIRINESTTNAQNGDGQWYQISSVTNSTTLVLYNNYTGSNVTTAAAGYTIGEAPILPEDYQDLPLYRALEIYYTSIVANPEQASLYKDLYNTGFAALNEEFGSKTTDVVLIDTDAPVYNPNVFVRSITQN